MIGRASSGAVCARDSGLRRSPIPRFSRLRPAQMRQCPGWSVHGTTPGPISVPFVLHRFLGMTQPSGDVGHMHDHSRSAKDRRFNDPMRLRLAVGEVAQAAGCASKTRPPSTCRPADDSGQ